MASKDLPWYKMYAKDWSGDVELRLCTPGARGLLADIMSLCHFGNPYGYLTRRNGERYSDAELCQILHYKPNEYRKLYAELLKRERVIENGAGPYVPRLVKEREKLLAASEYGSRGGNPALVTLPTDNRKDNIKDKPKDKTRRKPRKKESRKRFDYSEAFGAFWDVYPRPIGKAQAFAEWEKAIESGVEARTIIEAAKRYAKSVEGDELRFVKHPKTWLNAGSWDDVLDGEQAIRIRDEKRRAAALKQYRADLDDFVTYVRENAKAGEVFGGGTIDDLIDRIEPDVERRIGKKGLEHFRREVEKHRKRKG